MNERKVIPELKDLWERLGHSTGPKQDHRSYELAVLIIETGGIIMGAIDDLGAAVTKLEAQVTAENQTLQTIVDSLGTATTEIEQLQTQISSGTPVTGDQLESLATRVATAAQAMADATSAAQASATTAPASGGVAPASGAVAPTAELPLYTFDNDPSTIDPATATDWPKADVETTDTPPRPLFHFTGDTAGSAPTGDGIGGLWHLYTGPTQPVA